MLNFTFAQTLFLGIGAAFVVLSVLFCILPRNRRFGVLSLLIANIFLWSSIVYCKNISNFLSGLGLSSELLTQDKLYLGITVGVGLFVIWFLLWTLVKKFLKSFQLVFEFCESQIIKNKSKLLSKRTLHHKKLSIKSPQ